MLRWEVDPNEWNTQKESSDEMAAVGEDREEPRVYEENTKEYRFPSFERMNEFAQSMPYGMCDD